MCVDMCCDVLMLWWYDPFLMDGLCGRQPHKNFFQILQLYIFSKFPPLVIFSFKFLQKKFW